MNQVQRAGFIVLVTLAFVALGSRFVLARDQTPRIVLLGSGEHVSALIVAGDATMVIATGTDGAAFLNAISSALPFTDRAIDVLVITGGSKDLAVAAAARSSLHARRMFVLDGSLMSKLDELGLDSSAMMFSGTRIKLSTDLTVTFETAVTGSDAASIKGWQAMVEQRTTRVRIVSDARLLGSFHDRRNVSALVVASKPDPGVLPASFSSLAVPASVSDPASLLAPSAHSIPVVKIENGRTLTFRFPGAGLRLPSGAQRINGSAR